MAANPTNSDIMEAIGHLRGTVEAVQKAQTSADRSRSNIYKAIEDTNKNVAKIASEVNTEIRNVSFEVEKMAGIQAQIREETKGLHAEQQLIRTDMKPLMDVKEDLPRMVEGWRDLNKTSKRLIWLLGIGGGGLIAFVLFLGEAAKIALINWLTIKPPGT